MQVYVAHLDLKGWEFIESSFLQHGDSNGLKETFELIPQSNYMLLEGGGFNFLNNSSELSSSTKGNLPFQKAHFLDGLPEYSGVLDMNQKLIKTLFAYLDVSVL